LTTLVRLSFQDYGLKELIAGSGTWIGVANYTHVLSDPFFWTVLIRTIVFTAVNVGLTMVIGMAIALLLERLGRVMRTAVIVTLVFAWAIPPLSAVAIWQWMIDYEFGVVNWLITASGLADYEHHNWFANPVQGFSVITAVVVWGAVPFIAITLYAALTQVPKELTEAAQVDGAGSWRTFRSITIPVIRPVLVICTSLSIIWDFQVFTQIWVMTGGRPPKDYFTMAIYSFTESFKVSQYGQGAAIALIMVACMLVATVFYIRQMLRIGEIS
jgi:N,N'-diacetylchitobiose transport system permease protein